MLKELPWCISNILTVNRGQGGGSIPLYSLLGISLMAERDLWGYGAIASTSDSQSEDEGA